MKDILLNEIKGCISAWDKSDIYAISLFVYDEDDNPCQPTITLGYNTLTQYKREIENAWDENEAKWNYAFWLQNCEMRFGTGESQKIVKSWLEKNGYSNISNDDMYNDDEATDEDDLLQITEAFVNVLIEIVQELHRSEFIKEQFGKDLPVIIHELEYYEKIAEQNLKANPPELLEDFVRFCTGM